MLKLRKRHFLFDSSSVSVKMNEPTREIGSLGGSEHPRFSGETRMSERIVSKSCSYCKQIRPLSEFYKAKKTVDGLYCNCKTCHYSMTKKYGQTEKGK